MKTALIIMTLACNLAALTPKERKEHAALTHKLLAAATKRDATANGYSFTIDKRRVSIAEAGQWIAFEERCCPFIDFQLAVTRNDGPLVLTLSGQEGVKEFLAAELGFAKSK